ncbi:hypothetical protein L6164_025901 [Bauhinia variegata]|uniref:Uncharacterized protein n=1 Tax=Bauhinia variegata TaxID=167791 RepID=A0ACB9M2C7_BAUVA|nr:hypothetical protein L6164_025901 [Bauhinia variegata]
MRVSILHRSRRQSTRDGRCNRSIHSMSSMVLFLPSGSSMRSPSGSQLLSDCSGQTSAMWDFWSDFIGFMNCYTS